MKIKTSQKILNFIENKKGARAKEISDELNIKPRALFKQLANLLSQDKIYKIGMPPKVFYLLKKNELKSFKNVDSPASESINERFIIITLRGEIKEGQEAFYYWCEKNKLPYEKTLLEYEKTLKKYDAFKKDGLIDGMSKMKNTFKNVYLDSIYYLDFYSIERFGKTKLGQLLLYAKQSQNRELMKRLILSIKPQIDFLIKKYKIDGVGFIPPTVKREIQFMKELQKNLNLKMLNIAIFKVKTPVIIPQKTLNKLEDRIENARNSIIADEGNKFKNILLIDDAVGSGATLNETAGQIKNKNICKNVIGLAITGSFKGFDVISEV